MDGGTQINATTEKGIQNFSALNRAVDGGTAGRPSSRGSPGDFSALNRAVDGGTMARGEIIVRKHVISVLSIEPWMVEQSTLDKYELKFGISVLSIEPWMVEQQQISYDLKMIRVFQCSQSSRGWWNQLADAHQIHQIHHFSALNRAVDGGTYTYRNDDDGAQYFSALNRAVDGGTIKFHRANPHVIHFSALNRAVDGGTVLSYDIKATQDGFQCSQSSRGWWNTRNDVRFPNPLSRISVLSIEPWMVEPGCEWAVSDCANISVLSIEPWMVEPMERGCTWVMIIYFSALNRAVDGGTQQNRRPNALQTPFQCSQSSRGWWNRMSRPRMMVSM